MAVELMPPIKQGIESASAPSNTRRPELQQDRDTSAARKQTGGHPTRMHGSHDGMHITEHHRKAKKR